MPRIGIDFDNTIACYDHAFVEVAALLGLAVPASVRSKIDVKAQLHLGPEGDIEWQRLQGQVYGRHMLRAEMFPGFMEYCQLSRLRGYQLVIVSHKSEFGHFDEERVPLRDQALRWMERQRVFDEDGCGIRREDVFFEGTLAEKIDRIRALACAHFIDDLREVFDEPAFPATTEKVLFGPGNPTDDAAGNSAGSWRELARRMFGEWTDVEVRDVVQRRFPTLDVREAALWPGRGNSRVYQLNAGDGARYVLKVYPDRQRDPRPRLQTEFAVSGRLSALGYPVAEPVACDDHLGWGIYRWIEGEPISVPDAAFVADAVAFVRRLHLDRRIREELADLPAASEACFSGAEIVRQIDHRLRTLGVVASDPLQQFLSNEFEPAFAIAAAGARVICADVFHEELAPAHRVPSPSDFGAHNALRVSGAGSVFFDFEYFGWDDPVKLASDVYWHPGMRLSDAQRAHWVTQCIETFRDDLGFARRLQAYLPLYGLRWCLIQLNEFALGGAAHRAHASPEKAADLDRVRQEQLEKSRVLLTEIKEVEHVLGRTIQASSAQRR